MVLNVVDVADRLGLAFHKKIAFMTTTYIHSSTSQLKVEVNETVKYNNS
jgi:hypothetical protein